MKTIIWDVDDVLNNLTRTWLDDAWRPAHPQCKLRYSQLRENPPHRLLGVRKQVYLDSLDAFRLSAAGRELTPVPEVLAWFAQHGHRARHVVLTATPRVAAPWVSRWVFTHFGRFVHTFGVVPSLRRRRGDAVRRVPDTKADYLRWFGHADLFIDDNPHNIAQVAHLGVSCVTMPRPWNRARGGVRELLRRVTDALDA